MAGFWPIPHWCIWDGFGCRVDVLWKMGRGVKIEWFMLGRIHLYWEAKLLMSRHDEQKI
jgi:hypothetical protein